MSEVTQPDKPGKIKAVKAAADDYLSHSPRGALGLIADALAVLTPVAGAYVLVTDGSAPQGFLAVVVSGLAVTFLGISFRLHKRLASTELRYQRQLRDVEAMPVLAESMSHLAQATVAQTSREFELHLEAACRSLARVYDIATGSPCRITVLQVWHPHKERRPGDRNGGQPATGLAVRRVSTSYTPTAAGGPIDWVEDNTDFLSLVTTGRSHYMCNDLPREVAHGYRNSHWTQEDIERFIATDSWPYRSTIVWPIQESPPSASTPAPGLAGFLCLDSTALGNFDNRFDAPAGKCCAHALYSGLSTYRTAHQQLTEGSDRHEQ